MIARALECRVHGPDDSARPTACSGSRLRVPEVDDSAGRRRSLEAIRDRVAGVAAPVRRPAAEGRPRAELRMLLRSKLRQGSLVVHALRATTRHIYFYA